MGDVPIRLGIEWQGAHFGAGLRLIYWYAEKPPSPRLLAD